MLNKAAKARKEFREYWDTLAEKGREAADALDHGPEAKRLVAEARETIRKMNERTERLGLKVYDPTTGAMTPHQPIGDFPAIISKKTLDAIEKGAGPAWDTLKDEMVRDKTIPYSENPDEIEASAFEHTRKVRQDYLHNKPSTRKLPPSAYDRSLESLTKYVSDWVDRASLREAFGTRGFSPEGKAAGTNLFDLAREKTTDPATERYITLVENMAYGRTQQGAFGKLASGLANIGTASQLANWKTTFKNLTGGVAMNINALGPGAFNVVGAWNAIKEGREKGILLTDMMNQMNDANQQGWTRTLAGGTLKAAAFNFSERLVRGQAIVGAKSLWRMAQKAHQKNPTGRSSLQYLALFKRLGFSDPEGLILEGGKGPLFDTFLRRMVNRVQAGYSYADVPVYLSSDAGRFIQQYSKWGTEQTQHVRSRHRPTVRSRIRYRQGSDCGGHEPRNGRQGDNDRPW